MPATQYAERDQEQCAITQPFARWGNADGDYTLHFLEHEKILPTMKEALAATPLSDGEYHAKTMAVLGAIEATLDRWLDEDVVDIDTHRTGGLLELSFPDHSKIVLNTQPPLHELWLAARGGGFHFRYVNGQWVDTKDGREFHAALSAYVSAQAGKTLRFEVQLSKSPD